jgi:hypothetical protein
VTWNLRSTVAVLTAPLLVAAGVRAAPKRAEVIELEETEVEVVHEPVTEQTRNTPIPIYAELTSGDEDVTARLHYRLGDGDWRSVPMRRMSDGFGTEIPCSALKRAPELRYYIKFKDAEGTSVAVAGSRAKPFTVSISADPVDDPPHFPGKRPPKRCAPSREASDCERGDEPGCTEKESSPTRPEPASPRAVWLSLGLAQDAAFVSGNQVCTKQSQLEGGFSCFRESGTQYHGAPLPGEGGTIGSGPVLATTRVYLASDIRLVDELTLGLRVGYAIAGQGLRPDGGKSFFPMHAEVRGQYWLSEMAFPASVAAFLVISGGAAQIDGRKDAHVIEDRSVPPPPTQLDNSDEQTLDAYKKMGLSFVALGAGVFLPFAEQHGVLCDLKAMALFPDTGAAVELELGYALGL